MSVAASGAIQESAKTEACAAISYPKSPLAPFGPTRTIILCYINPVERSSN